MSGEQLFALLPLIILSGTILVLLLVIGFWRNFKASCTISVAGLLATLACAVLVLEATPMQVTPLVRIDGYGLMFAGLILLTATAISLMAYDYFLDRETLQDEFYVLLLSATLGALTLVFSTHFASFILGLELLGVSLYAMISYPSTGRLSLEAALKYLILSGVSSAFLLFGIALLFAITGALGFSRLAGFDFSGTNSQLMLMASVGLILAGVMFKLSLVPFHMWTPDIYEGAPAPVTAFVATISKGAIFAVLLRFFTVTGIYEYPAVITTLSVIAILSMLIGNLLALRQDNVKRVLAYSSIAHLGYLLVAFIAGGVLGGSSLAIEACSYFLLAYFVSTLGAFGVITLMSTNVADRDVDDLSEFKGLFWRRPVLSTVFSAMLLSLAGIPLTVGFIGKFYIFVAGVQSELWMLVSVLIIGSGIGLFYYLRIIFNMTRRTDEKFAVTRIPVAGGWVVVSLTLALLTLGLYPTPLVELISQMIGSLV